MYSASADVASVVGKADECAILFVRASLCLCRLPEYVNVFVCVCVE